jgi:hypothetical protein
MAMEWLFGRERKDGDTWALSPRVFDIDVVGAVYREMEATSVRHRDAHLANAQNDAERESIAARWAALEPRVLLNAENPAADAPQQIPLDDVRGLVAYDRGRLRVEGAGVVVGFDRRITPVVSMVTDGVSTVIVDDIARLLRSSGRRRFQPYGLAAIAIVLGASVLTALGVWALLESKPHASVTLFVTALLALAWGVAAWAAAKVVRLGPTRTKDTPPASALRPVGHRFREGSLSGVRDRIVNVRATAMVSLVTVPVGAAIGAAVTAWLS